MPRNVNQKLSILVLFDILGLPIFGGQLYDKYSSNVAHQRCHSTSSEMMMRGNISCCTFCGYLTLMKYLARDIEKENILPKLMYELALINELPNNAVTIH